MIVTMDVFSGMPNPTWKVEGKELRQLVSRLAGKAMASADSTDGALGFRGYVISAVSDDMAATAGLADEFRLGGGFFTRGVTAAGFALPAIAAAEEDEAALWLLGTAKGAVPDDVLDYVKGFVQARAKLSGPASPAKAVRKAPEPAVKAPCVIRNTPYNPGFWNVPAVQPRNNCYNYAMNFRSDTFAQPGRISGHPNNVMQCPNVAAAANFDGCTAVCSGRNKNVALVIWPGRDYHWYRKHSNGFWGHKPGQTAARNIDNLGRIIGGALTPRNCNRGPYTVFCGYRYSPVGMRVA
jgi:hypothetical protein